MNRPNSVKKQHRPRRPFWAQHLRSEVQYALDLAILGVAFVLAYLLRFLDVFLPSFYIKALAWQLPAVVLLQLAVLSLTGVYQFVWRYVGLAEVPVFVRAALYSAAPILVLRLSLPESWSLFRVPISVILMDTLLAFGGVLAIRVLRRHLYERYERSQGEGATKGPPKRVLLVGAEHAGVAAARELKHRGGRELEVVGFVDDDLEKRGTVIQGIPVLGTIEQIREVVQKHRVEQVIITTVEASRSVIRRIVAICEGIPVEMKIIPGLHEILEGPMETGRIRDVKIEDLLGRQPVEIDEGDLTRFLTGKRVMVTGAGGSIGSQLSRHVTRFEPSALILVERAEFALFEVDRHLRELRPDMTPVPVVADLNDENRMRHILTRHRPQVILHAAAHKHVPMMETNGAEAIRNNVLATRTLATLAGELATETFVLVSTDKAVRPTSIMGASKRLAELVVQDLDRRLDTRFVAVRFGNVLDSTGSVVPIFRRQIARGGPVTLTHPDMTRYFMTIPEAVQLVLQAGALCQGGEILILDMGEPVRILDLAMDMINLSALKPYEDIDIVFTGVRPGEKLFEELDLDPAQIAPTRHPKIYVAKIAGCSPKKLKAALGKLDRLARLGHEGAIRDTVAEILPEARLEMTWHEERVSAGGGGG